MNDIFEWMIVGTFGLTFPFFVVMAWHTAKNRYPLREDE